MKISSVLCFASIVLSTSLASAAYRYDNSANGNVNLGVCAFAIVLKKNKINARLKMFAIYLLKHVFTCS